MVAKVVEVEPVEDKTDDITDTGELLCRLIDDKLEEPPLAEEEIDDPVLAERLLCWLVKVFTVDGRVLVDEVVIKFEEI